MGTRPVLATVHLARGLIAAADVAPCRARGELEDAIDLFDASDAPFETGRARRELARVLAELDRPSDAAVQARLALTAFERLGATREAERARRLVDARGKVSAKVSGLSQRELEVLRLLAHGLSNQEIAERLVLSIRTVQRHVENIYGRSACAAARRRAPSPRRTNCCDAAPPWFDRLTMSGIPFILSLSKEHGYFAPRMMR